MGWFAAPIAVLLGNSVCHLSNRQTCLGVAATRYLTGPDSVIRLSVSDGTGTGEFTHNEPFGELHDGHAGSKHNTEVADVRTIDDPNTFSECLKVGHPGLLTLMLKQHVGCRQWPIPLYYDFGENHRPSPNRTIGAQKNGYR
jgi:hypothetical protein